MTASRSQLWLGLAAAAVLLIVPAFIDDLYILRMLALGALNAIVVTGLTVFVGFTGQISIAQAAFFGLGAYTSAIVTKSLGVPFLLGVLLAGLVGAVAAFLIGMPTLRMRDNYLAMATLAFGHVMFVLFVNLVGITGGPTGFAGIPAPSIGSFLLVDIKAYFYVIAVVLILILGSARVLLNSKTGIAFRAIGQNEIAAKAVGINILNYKTFAFAFSGMCAGIAGGLYAHFDSYISPDSFTFLASVQYLIMAVVGGLGNMFGGAVGAFVLTILGEELRFFVHFQPLIYGLALILILIFAPGGLSGLLGRLGGLVSSRGSRSEQHTGSGEANVNGS